MKLKINASSFRPVIGAGILFRTLERLDCSGKYSYRNLTIVGPRNCFLPVSLFRFQLCMLPSVRLTNPRSHRVKIVNMLQLLAKNVVEAEQRCVNIYVKIFLTSSWSSVTVNLHVPVV